MYTSIDAWIPGIGAFQMTVGKNHDIKGGDSADLAMLGQAILVTPSFVLPLVYQESTSRN